MARCSGGLAGEVLGAGRLRTHTVIMQAVAFSPPALAVRQGDLVVWVNRDPFPHTATAAE